jgi:hypothetical protein
MRVSAISSYRTSIPALVGISGALRGRVIIPDFAPKKASPTRAAERLSSAGRIATTCCVSSSQTRATTAISVLQSTPRPQISARDRATAPAGAPLEAHPKGKPLAHHQGSPGDHPFARHAGRVARAGHWPEENQLRDHRGGAEPVSARADQPNVSPRGRLITTTTNVTFGRTHGVAPIWPMAGHAFTKKELNHHDDRTITAAKPTSRNPMPTSLPLNPRSILRCSGRCPPQTDDAFLAQPPVTYSSATAPCTKDQRGQQHEQVRGQGHWSQAAEAS